jgi:hypothetical protein
VATYTDPTTIVSPGKSDPVQPATVVVLIGGILTLLGAIGFFVMTMVTNHQIKTVEADITTKQIQVAKLQPTAEKLSALSDQAKGLHTIFDNQKRWESVLDMFALRLHKEMVVTSLQMNDKGSVVLAGTVPDYITYAKVFRAFTDAQGVTYFSSVKPTLVTKVNDAKLGTYVSFTFSLGLQPAVLNKGSVKEITQ